MCNCNCGCNPCNCGCQPNICNPQPTPPCDCPIKDLSTNCIVYTGEDLECSGITKNTQLSDVIRMLDEYMCTAIEQKASSVIINVGTGAEIYAGVNTAGKKKLRTLISSDNSVTITQNTDEIDLKAATVTVDGSETKVTAGTNVTVTGAGTIASPYVVNSTSSLPYKVYTALITQTGTSAPTAIVLENTLGATISYTYNAVGNYSAVASGGVFTLDKTYTTLGLGSSSAVVRVLRASRLNANTITLQTWDSTSNALDSVLNAQGLFEIRVYP